MSSIGISIEQAIKNFKAFLENQGRANATILAYTKDIEQLNHFVKKQGKTTPQTIIKQDIDDFKTHLEQKKFTAKTISRKINSIKSFFKFLQTEKLITENPAIQVEHPKYEIKPPRILTKIEYKALRDTCKTDTRVASIVELLLQTGMRISEVAAIEIEDIDLEKNSINIKAYESHDSRVVPINNAVKETLKSYLKERPKGGVKNVFITKTGNPFLVRNIRSSIDRYFRLAGIDNAKVNDLRHTFIAHQLAQGTPLVYISKLAGHKRLSTTEKYLEFIKSKNGSEKTHIFEL